MPTSFLTLILMLLVLGVATCALLIFAMAMIILRPPRMTDGKAIWVHRRLSPGDFGLRFENVRFDIRDEQSGRPLRIAGWWMPHASAGGRCAVLLHGYADAKVGVIAWAPLWHSLGFNILAIDLRAHGESGGTYFTGGFWERHDVGQVLDLLRAERPADAREVVLFGVGAGAAVATATAAWRDDLRAVVLENVPADFRSAAMAHLNRLGALGRPFQSIALRFSERIGQCDFAAVKPTPAIAQIRCPVMLISPTGNAIISSLDREEVMNSLRSRTNGKSDAYWQVTTGDRLAVDAEPREYERRLREFLRGTGFQPVWSDENTG